MAYTTPKTWVAGELVDDDDLNTFVRDNMIALKNLVDAVINAEALISSSVGYGGVLTTSLAKTQLAQFRGYNGSAYYLNDSTDFNWITLDVANNEVDLSAGTYSLNYVMQVEKVGTGSGGLVEAQIYDMTNTAALTETAQAGGWDTGGYLYVTQTQIVNFASAASIAVRGRIGNASIGYTVRRNELLIRRLA